MNGLCLGLKHIHGVVRTILVVNGRLGGCGELGTIAHFVVILVHDEAHQVVDFLLHIARERAEDICEIFADSHEALLVSAF